MIERRRTTRPIQRRPAGDVEVAAPKRWSALFAQDRPTEMVHSLEERDLMVALAGREFAVHYQVVVDRAGRPAGAEALLRWHRPGHGLTDAADFVSLVQSHDLQRQVTDLVIDDLVVALPVLRSLIDAPRTYFSLNAPARQLQDSMFPSRIAAFLRAENVSAGGVVVELTDPNEVTDWRAVHDAGIELQRLDIALAVDDAGAEPGDLLYRDQCEAPIVKLDRAVVSECRRWEHERRVVEATVQLCKASDLTVIAEGVEDAEISTWLTDLGVDFQQGFHFGRPEPIEDLVRRLERVRASTPSGRD